MKTLFDLRINKDYDLIKNIQSLYKEPLKVVNFEKDSISSCIGCWSCWLKTPGKCVMNDKMTEIYSDYVNSDTVILLMDTAQGFINYQAKAFLDRTIPHYHPYIELVNGECHHFARYDSYPDMVFYFNTEGLNNEEEQVIEDYLYRTAFHFKSKAYRIVINEFVNLKLLKSRKAKNKTLQFESTDSIEKLIIYNGSPRRSGSNSSLILKTVSKVLGDKVEIRDLKLTDKWNDWANAFKSEKNVMFFMPLYVHAMPSHVMKFIEKLEVSDGNISFFVQSGFPESSQSYFLEAYFEQLALRLNRGYLGSVIKGGVESLRMRPPESQEKMIMPLVKVIEDLIFNGKFNKSDLQKLAIPVKFGVVIRILIKMMSKKMLNSFWDNQLKSNNAYEKRFDRPYLFK